MSHPTPVRQDAVCVHVGVRLLAARNPLKLGSFSAPCFQPTTTTSTAPLSAPAVSTTTIEPSGYTSSSEQRDADDISAVCPSITVFCLVCFNSLLHHFCRRFALLVLFAGHGCTRREVFHPRFARYRSSSSRELREAMADEMADTMSLRHLPIHVQCIPGL